jgi:TonB family protein
MGTQLTLPFTLAATIGALTLSCRGSDPHDWSPTHGYRYRGFHVGMTRGEMHSKADSLRLSFGCQPVAARSVGTEHTMCGTPGALGLGPDSVLTHFAFVAAFDSQEAVLYLMLREPPEPAGHQVWLQRLVAAWGSPRHSRPFALWRRRDWIARGDVSTQSYDVSLSGSNTYRRLGQAAQRAQKAQFERTPSQMQAPSERQSSRGEVFIPGVVDEQPAVVTAPPIVYPEDLKRAGITGRVVVEFIVDTAGHAEPHSVRIVESDHPGFIRPSKEYVTGTVFRPARLRGQVVRVRLRIPLDFKLTPAPK